MSMHVSIAVRIALMSLLCVTALLMQTPSASLAQREQPLAYAHITVSDSGGTRIAQDWAPPVEAPGLTRIASSLTCSAASPALISPAEGSTSSDLDMPRYTWAAVTGVTEYLFQVALDSTFSVPLTNEQRRASATQSPVSHFSFFSLKPSTTYYWRVSSVCADGQFGTFSNPVSFKTGTGTGNPPCTLPPPTLIAPTDGAQVTTLIPTMAWSREPNTYEYAYQISTDSTFATNTGGTTYSGIDPSSSGDITLGTNDNLMPNTTYYWRVASICAEIDRTAAYSTPLSFRSGPASGTFLPPPALTAPVDAATTGSIRVSLLYTDVVGATGYYVKTYTSFSNAENDRLSSSFTTPGTSVTSVFEPEQTIYWRVKTRNSYGWGDLSGIRSFTTPKVSAVATITPESGGTLIPNPGYLTVNFPSGVVTGTTTLNFHLLASPQQRLPNFRFANRAFTLEAFIGSQQISQFSNTFTLIVTYDSNDLTAAGISDPTQLNLAFWDGSAWQNILPCSGCTVDTTNHKLTVVLNHLTEFALVAPGGTSSTYRSFLPLVVR